VNEKRNSRKAKVSGMQKRSLVLLVEDIPKLTEIKSGKALRR